MEPNQETGEGRAPLRPPPSVEPANDLPGRHALVALNAERRLARATVCRLATEPGWHLEPLPRSAGARAERSHHLGVPVVQLERAHRAARDPSRAERELERAEDRGALLLTRAEAAYPRPLLDLELPPPVLYLEGSPEVLDRRPAAAVVGSRRCGTYGRQAAEHFAHALAAAGVPVVSGFAKGVDAAAHRAALGAAGGRTVAVLGCGLDSPYPKSHRELRREILGGGALLSEFPWGQEPRPWSFPVRNRVIAALADLTLVVQATHRSGSLITAHHALELGREVFAVPGSVFDRGSQGTHALLRDGAGTAARPRDLLESLGFGGVRPPPGKQAALPCLDSGPPPESPPPAGSAGALLDHLPPGRGLSAEELAAATGQAVDRVLGKLLELELSGFLRRLPGPVYLRGGP